MDITIGNQIEQTAKNQGVSIDFTGKAVLDETRGYLVYLNNNWVFVGVAQIKNWAFNNFKKIALILESPHKKEFDSNGNPIRPANGKTGLKINDSITSRPQIINALNITFAYEVRIMNPIQYQASCYSVLGNNYSRDNTNQVFRKLFSTNGFNLRADFKNRIDAYRPDLIINCCTHGLKDTVKVAINQTNSYSLNNYVSDIHPSRW